MVVIEQVATTTMDVALANPGRSGAQAELMVPVPDGAVVRGFTFEGAGAEPTARVLPKDEARRTYDAIVAKVRDPALLEFVGYNLVRSSVFPVVAGGTQKVRLTYEHLLPADGDRVDYLLPRSESIAYHVPWRVSVRIKSKRPISTVYSPSHKLETRRPEPGVVSARIADDAIREPGPFRLSYLLERDGVTASLLTYPDPSVGGGYFLLLAGLPARVASGNETPAIRREVTLVLDRSGSMQGKKLEQVREAALQILAGLEEDEPFNIILYNDAIDRLAPRPLLKSTETVRRAREYLNQATARGGTNIHDALLEALRQEPTEGILPIVLFLTDGLPTVGQTSEVHIRNVAAEANPHERRIFTFGVGVDVNTPLLENIAADTRATATFVLPAEDVEVKVGQVFKRLVGPVLASPTLRAGEPEGNAAPRAFDVTPARLPDLFEDDQLVLLGKYRGTAPVTFQLAGNYRGRQRTFTFTFELDKASTRNAFVPRLWASRKIALLVDAIRRQGANGHPLASSIRPPTPDPELAELVDEIVRLSTEFGILTEYTAFLAREGTDLSNRSDILAEANSNFVHRAVNTRSGLGSVNQETNSAFIKGQKCLNPGNAFWDADMNRVSISSVQQINDRAFYRKAGRWVDSRIVDKDAAPSRVIEFGSAEFRRLAQRLAREHRQGCISLPGEVVMVVDGKPVLIKSPGG